MNGDIRLFIHPEARTVTPPPPLLALLRRMRLEGLNGIHGTSLEDLGLTTNVPTSAVDVLEGLVGQLGCGFAVTGAWGRAVGLGAPRSTSQPLVLEPVADLVVSVREGLPAPAAWPASLASRERLIAAGFDSLGLLADQTERALLEGGFVSLEELLAIAKVLWRSTGAGFASELKRAARLHVDLNLILPVSALGWPRDLTHILSQSNAKRLLDVAAKTRDALMAVGVAECDISLIERNLWRRGLGLAHAVDPRAEEYAEALAEMFAFDLSVPPPEATLTADFLEDEVNRFVRGLDQERNVSISARCLGWDGRGGEADVRVAEAFNLSRERIRQVRDHVIGRFRSRAGHLPLVKAALAFVEARLPGLAEGLESGLAAHGLCRRPFRLEGLIHLADERGLAVTFVLVEEEAVRLVVRRADADAARRQLPRAARAMVAGDKQPLTRLLQSLGGTAAEAQPSAVNVAATGPASEDTTAPAPSRVGDTSAGVTHWELAQWMLSRARDAGVFPATRPWSLIELGWEGADLERLRAWGQVGLIETPRELARSRPVDGTSLTGREAVALVFLGYAMEIGRREGHEGELWPFVHRSLSDALRGRFFVEGGMLRSWIRDALEEACPLLGLRHVFGQDGIQAWIRTVFLQFGVSEAGWQRLPWWLSGHQATVTIDDLLDGEAPLHSRSFADLWRVLQRGRFGHRDEGRLRRELRGLGSPWLIGTDLGRVATAALARPEVVLIDGERPDLSEGDGSGGGLPWESRLRWKSGDEPRFEVDLIDDPPGRMAGQYLLVVHDLARVPAVWDSAGGWRIPSGPLVIEPRKTESPLELLLDGVRVLQGTLCLADPDEEVLLFDLASGRRLDPWGAVPSGRAVALLTRSDLIVTPEPPIWFGVFGGGWKLWRLDRGFAPEIKVALGAETLWMPVLRDSPAPVSRGRAWSSGSARWGETTTVRVQMEAGLEPLMLRVGARAYDVDSAEGKHVASVTLDPSIRPSARARVATIVQGRRTMVPVQLDLRQPWGMARRRPSGGWQPIGAQDVLDPADLEWSRLLISAPTTWGVPPEELAVLEGHTFQARPRSAEHGLAASLHGLGAALVLCRGPYNRVDAPTVLAASVVAAGILSEISHGGGCVRLRLRHAVDTTDEHSVWLWSEGKDAPEVVPRERLSHSGIDWCVVDETKAPLACAIAYRGAWLGARYLDSQEGPLHMAGQIGATANWRALALWLRWWRAPILSEPLRSVVEARAMQEPAATLSVWMANPAGLPAAVCLQTDTAWPTVVQHFFWQWRPTPLQALSLIDALALLSGDPATDWVQGWKGFEELLSVHPVLLALIAREGVHALYPTASRAETARLLQALRDRIAGFNGLGDGEWRAALRALLESAARSMQVDSAFINPGLLKEARQLASGDRPARDNLRVGLVVGPLRRFIAAALVDDFAKEIQ